MVSNFLTYCKLNEVVRINMKDNLDGSDGGQETSLPQPFVESMRTLFDILDDQHTGRVKFAGESSVTIHTTRVATNDLFTFFYYY